MKDMKGVLYEEDCNVLLYTDIDIGISYNGIY